MKQINAVITLFFVAAAFAGVGCSPGFKSAGQEAEKAKFLSSSSVFNDGNDPVRPEDPKDPMMPPRVPTDPDPRNPPPKPTTPINIPVVGICSAESTRLNAGVNYTTSVKLKVTLTPEGTTAPACTLNEADVRDRLFTRSKIDIGTIYQTCLKEGKVSEGRRYHINVLGTNQSGTERYISDNLEYFTFAGAPVFATDWLSVQHSDGKYTINSGSGKSASPNSPQGPISPLGVVKKTPFTIVVDDSGKVVSGSSLPVPVLMDSAHDYSANTNCFNGSPLVIQMKHAQKAKPGAIELTAPWAGVLFDILGANSAPVAHLKKQISWFTAQSRDEYYFLVKPDAQGQVNGIDEMFGDNTMGPDGRFAADGFAALAKFDGRRENGRINMLAWDKKIDRLDAVFSELRLWHDLNGDGQAQAGELQTLAAAGIESIDLNYDPTFYERDRYGNETRMRSVVNSTAGMLLIFDLWFAIRH